MSTTKIALLKLSLIASFLPIWLVGFTQNNTQEFEPLNIEKVRSDIDTIRQQMDSTIYYAKATYEILKEEVKLFGWKKTIEINSGIFLPIVVFIGLYLVWLINRKLSK